MDIRSIRRTIARLAAAVRVLARLAACHRIVARRAARRRLRDLRRRADWVHQARTAPTLQHHLDLWSRPPRSP
jgi:hypothetical protein